MNKNRFFPLNRRQWTVLAVILLPVLQAGVIAFFCRVKYGTALPMPKWNDEGAYFELVKTWLFSGQPLGYWGFNGAHAICGTGSAWSSAILFPYALFGMMFGWNYSSAMFANLLFYVLALTVFVYLVRPDQHQLVRIFILETVSTAVILYSVTLMSELLRFSLAIVLAGMLYKLYFRKSGKVFSYVVVPVYLLFSIQIYIFFVFAVPVYVFGILKKQKIWVRIAVSIVSLLAVGGLSYCLLHLISSNYNIYKTEALLAALQEHDFREIFRSLSAMFRDGLYGLYSCFRSSAGHGMFRWFVPFLALLILIPLLWGGYSVYRNKKWEKDSVIAVLISFSVALFLCAFITVYSMEPFTFFRSLGIVVLFAMYFVSLSDHKRIFQILCFLYGLGIIFLPVNLREFTEERYPKEEIREEWEQLDRELSEVIPVTEEKDPWENTIVTFTLEPKVLASFPAGSGVNMMLYEDYIPPEAKYLFFSKKSENLRSDWLEHDYDRILSENRELFDQKYQILWENGQYVLYAGK